MREDPRVGQVVLLLLVLDEAGVYGWWQCRHTVLHDLAECLPARVVGQRHVQRRHHGDGNVIVEGFVGLKVLGNGLLGAPQACHTVVEEDDMRQGSAPILEGVHAFLDQRSGIGMESPLLCHAGIRIGSGWLVFDF